MTSGQVNVYTWTSLIYFHLSAEQQKLHFSYWWSVYEMNGFFFAERTEIQLSSVRPAGPTGTIAQHQQEYAELRPVSQKLLCKCIWGYIINQLSVTRDPSLRTKYTSCAIQNIYIDLCTLIFLFLLFVGLNIRCQRPKLPTDIYKQRSCFWGAIV